MKRTSITLAAFALLALGCEGPTPTSPATSLTPRTPTPSGTSFIGGPLANASNGVVHRVSVGGHDGDVFGHTDANFSLVAIEHGDGSVSGQWTDQFGQADGGIHVAVNCVSVLANQAWISGVITSGSFGGFDFTGFPAITRVVDIGTSANDSPDAISFSFIGLATPCTARPSLPLLAMSDGQVKVD